MKKHSQQTQMFVGKNKFCTAIIACLSQIYTKKTYAWKIPFAASISLSLAFPSAYAHNSTKTVRKEKTTTNCWLACKWNSMPERAIHWLTPTNLKLLNQEAWIINLSYRKQLITKSLHYASEFIRWVFSWTENDMLASL